jgi:hypothetical protein
MKKAFGVLLVFAFPTGHAPLAQCWSHIQPAGAISQGTPASTLVSSSAFSH